jgi:ribosome biogenesis GTPase A
MAHIHWYPGHIAKAERKLKELINLVDVVIEVIDARIPLSSVYPDIKKLLGEKPRLIILNKADLADETQTTEWKKFFEIETGFPVLASCASKNNDISTIVNKLIELAKPKIDKLVAKGLLPSNYYYNDDEICKVYEKCYTAMSILGDKFMKYV